MLIEIRLLSLAITLLWPAATSGFFPLATRLLVKVMQRRVYLMTGLRPRIEIYQLPR